MLRSETARDLTMGAGMGDACAQGDVPARGHRSPRLLLEPLLSSPITFTPSPERLRHLEAGILKDAERHRQLEWLGEQALREYASPMPPVASQLRGSAARAGLLQPLPPSLLNERLAKAMEYNTTLEEELRSALAQVSMLQNALQLARDDSTQRVAASAAQAHEHRLRLSSQHHCRLGDLVCSSCPSQRRSIRGALGRAAWASIRTAISIRALLAGQARSIEPAQSKRTACDGISKYTADAGKSRCKREILPSLSSPAFRALSAFPG